MNAEKWNNPAYQRIVSVENHIDKLVVAFEDGTVVRLKTEQLLPPGVHSPAWDASHFDNYEIVVPTASGEVEIPWSTIRLLTDPEFAAHWARVAEEQAKQIGSRLRELRRKRNLTSKEVAERAGITPQSLSRIEHGRHDVVFTTLRKILAAMGYTLKDLAEVQVAPSSLGEFLNRLESVGLKRGWILNRLLPEDLLERLDRSGTDDTSNLVYEAAKHISRIFNWPPDDIMSSKSLSVDPTIAQAARFKVQGHKQVIQATAYAVYAHYVALLALEATQHIKVSRVPENPDEIRKVITDKYGSLALDTLLKYVWDLGIPVIPLQDSGAFHGACWRIGNRNVIVLKQVTPYQARWLFDLVHELSHVARHLSEHRSSIIEADEISPLEDDSGEEWEASSFASELLLFGRAEELAEISVKFAQHKVEFLKSAVLRVAAAEHVPVDVLANYLAYRLSMQNINWWGAANNLQITEPSPLEIARRFFLEYVNLDRLNPDDQDLLLRAVTK